ncbi:hypothetical protein AK812_SmicGene18640 [Symbiodinium microadriaticum]|uniref:Uncharacterized protein n=1 Tax=Symbiodinium microadriaticum TaxID=2951 RepID=A0A1Q9DUL4_SYMMI|nr:hypothetical protein AK812_SmicGene18640 [Symbiodinium microadriaticum]
MRQPTQLVSPPLLVLKQAMPDPSANLGDSGASAVQFCFQELDEIAAPFFPFVGRVAVLTPKDSLKEAISNISVTDIVGNVSASDLFATEDPELKVLLENALQVSEAMQQAKAKGTAEVEVDEARILQLEDAAKMDEAVRHDLADVKRKVEALQCRFLRGQEQWNVKPLPCNRLEMSTL